MSIEQKLSYFLKSYGRPFFVGNSVAKKMVFMNDVAQELFGTAEENGKFSLIFGKSSEEIELILEKTLKKDNCGLIYNCKAITKEQGTILVDLQVGYFNEEKTEVFFELIPQKDSRMEMAVQQVSFSKRPEAILNFDEKLSIVLCNEAFHDVFESSEALQHSHFKNDLINGFLPEFREKLVASIFKTLSSKSSFSTKIKVFTATGEERWYEMDLERRTLDDSGTDKIMAYMTNIEKQVEIEEEFSLLKNYLSTMQELTENILFRVNPKSMVLSHSLESLGGKDLGKEIIDFHNILLEQRVIHPEESKKFRDYLKSFYTSKAAVVECTLRAAVATKEYQWYTIRGKRICDKEGNLIEVVGAMVNVQESQKIKAEYDQTQEYFEILQEISGDSFFTIHVQTKNVSYTGRTTQAQSVPTTISDFPESIFHMVHPEDLKEYKKFAYDMMNGIGGTNQTRLLLKDGNFNWFEVKSGAMRDSSGNVFQVVGKITNIQKEKMNEVKLSSTNQYFLAMQSMSGESFFTVDVKRKVLRPRGEVAKELGLAPEIYNFPESLEYKIHPEDREKRNLFNKNATDGISGQIQLRMKSQKGEFQWYEVYSEIIRDEEGNVIEYIGKISNINDKMTLQADYSALNKYFTAIQYLTDEILFHIDIQSRIFYLSDDNGEGFGDLPVEIPDYVEIFIEKSYIPPDQIENFRIQSERLLAGEAPEQFEREFAVPTGGFEWHSIKISYIYDETGKPIEIFGTVRNIQGEKNINTQFSLLHQYFYSVKELTNEMLCHIELDTMTYRHSSKSAFEMGIPYEIPNYVETFIEKEYVRPEDANLFREYIRKILSEEISTYNIEHLSEEGKYEWYRVRCAIIKDEKGEPIEIFSTMKNIQHQRRLETRALYDEMTGALNKATYEEQAIALLAEAEAEGERHAVIFIDLDDFKGINDGFGHVYGDNLLATVGKRLKRLVRGNDLVGRIGGDEFSVLLRDVGSKEMVLKRTKLMLESLNNDFSFDGKVTRIKASVGVSIYPEHGFSYKNLIEKADLAVYQSKERGKNVVSLYSGDEIS